MAKLRLRVNGGARDVEVDDPDTPLLYVLRDELGLLGTRFGCGLAQCGACTVLVAGRATRACATPARAVAGQEITTIEGLGSPERPDPVQAAFIAEQAAQCGYCTAGLVLTARAFLQTNRRPTEREVRDALAGNLCRCGSHARVIRAVMRAATAMPEMVNPDCVQSQVEGNVIQTLSRALHEEIVWDRQRITSVNWASYPILTFPEVPAIECELIQRLDQPPLGVGEAASAPVAAALANAVFDATGVRLRTVPFRPERVKAALEGRST
jgi:nicotinate dehydrogenase subunit A